MKNTPKFTIVEETKHYVYIRDDGPWDKYPTITNRAEEVVEQLAPTLKGRRLFYMDSDETVDELRVDKNGKLAGFEPGGMEKLCSVCGKDIDEDDSANCITCGKTVCNSEDCSSNLRVIGGEETYCANCG